MSVIPEGIWCLIIEGAACGPKLGNSFQQLKPGSEA